MKHCSHFIHLHPILVKFGGGYVHKTVLCYCEFHENFLMSLNKVAFIGVLTSLSETASHSCCFSTNCYLANMRHFIITVTAVKVNASMGSGVPRNFFSGGGFNKFSWGQRELGSGGGSPLVRGSGGSCNLVQEILFHIVKFS